MRGGVSPFQRVIELIGIDRASDLSRAMGGKRLYVPVDPGPAHPLTIAVGEAAARLVASEFAQDHLEVPIEAGKRLRIVELKGSGLKIGQIAQAVGCTRRHVFSVLADERLRAKKPAETTQQPDFFD